jgi:hypothetical protein
MAENGRNHSSRFQEQHFASGAADVPPESQEKQAAGPDAAKQALEKIAELREYAA